MKRARKRPERKRLFPSTHLLGSYDRKGLSAVDAAAEAWDNALDAGASAITLILASDSVTFLDNGKGLKDIDLLFGLGYSKSAAVRDAIGLNGVGAKDAQITFGERAVVHSVHRGCYYTHSIDWRKIQEGGPFDWPYAFDGKPKPLSQAPEQIRKGGTLIKVTRLKVRARTNWDLAAKKLSHRYLPGLRNNKKFTIIDQRDLAPKVYELNAQMATIGFSPGEVVAGEASGKPFNVMFTTLNPDHDASLPGVHFGFGSRFIMRAQRLGDQYMPPSLYAEVSLSAAWKDSLSPNKISIAKNYEELSEAVLKILQDMISKLEKQAEQVHIEHVNLALAADFRNVIVFDVSKTGSNKKATKTTRVSERETGRGPVDPDPNKQAPLPEEGGEHGTENKKTRPNGIAFARSDLGNFKASKYELKADGTLVIQLNDTVPAIKLGYQAPYKPLALWPVIAREVANFCKHNADSLDTVLPGFVDALNRIGWEVSADLPDELTDKVFAYIMRQIPLTKHERAKLNKINAVGEDDDEQSA